MAELPRADIVKDLSEALEQELDSALRVATNAVSLQASRETEGVRMSIEVKTTLDLPVNTLSPVEEAELGHLQSERDEALRSLGEALREKIALTERLSEAEAARKAAENSLRRLKARVKELETGQPASGADPAELQQLRQSVETLRSEIERERIAHAAAQAALAFAEREWDTIRAEIDGAHAARESAEQALEESRRLAEDLQAELAELWRVLRDTRPGEPMAINLSVSEGVRRAGTERVQAKIVDVRELFRRRSHRWPVGI